MGVGWVEIIRIKAVLSSTRLELELELSLAISVFGIDLTLQSHILSVL